MLRKKSSFPRMIDEGKLDWKDGRYPHERMVGPIDSPRFVPIGRVKA